MLADASPPGPRPWVPPMARSLSERLGSLSSNTVILQMGTERAFRTFTDPSVSLTRPELRTPLAASAYAWHPTAAIEARRKAAHQVVFMCGCYAAERAALPRRPALFHA